jgi:Flp pilus assembly protein TadG
MYCARLRKLFAQQRKGTTAVEAAFVLPVFLMIVLGIVQICHAEMVAYVLRSACRNAARYGSASSITTAQTVTKANAILGCAINPSKVTLYVKNGDSFENSNTPPTSNAQYAALPDIELSTAEPRQLFAVRASVSYNDIAIIKLPFCSGLTITGDALMRHE